MLRAVSRLARPSALSRSLTCACAQPETQDLVPPKPGSIAEYHQHLLLQLPRPAAAAATSSGSWWPDLVEKEPAVVAAFAAVAHNEDLIGGRIKITAFEDVPRAAGSGSSGGSGGKSSSKRDAGPQPGTCNLLAFPAGVRFDGLSTDQLGLAVTLAAADEPAEVPLTAEQRRELEARESAAADLTLLVCCHGSRDARCGSIGPPLAAALQRLVQQKGLAEHIEVYQTSHIGGHKYAGNVVVYGAMHPCDGDWFGGLHAGNADQFLTALCGVELGVDGGAEDPVLRPHWRGRMGLSKAESQELWESGGAVEELDTAAVEGEGEDAEVEAAAAEWERMRRRPGPR